LGRAKLSSFHIANTGISIAFRIPSFNLVIFWRLEGAEAIFERAGAPDIGNGASERGRFAGEVTVADGEREPQFDRFPEPFDEDGLGSNGVDKESRVGVRETVRDCFVVVDGGEVGEALVKLNVKYLCSSMVQIEMTMLACT